MGGIKRDGDNVGSGIKRVRLLKVVIQPTFVIDDGTTLIERTSEPVLISAEQWPTYYKEQFLPNVELLEQSINQESSNGDKVR